jgi:lipopolysaccharide/colanic/teichoic acid biosynthesis glycosyltransferase
MVLVALLIRMSSPGPAIFRQVRCGSERTPFRLLQVPFHGRANADADERIARASQREVRSLQNAKDPRLTGIGRYLRLFNRRVAAIVERPAGDMSWWVRPAVPEEVEHYQRWQRRRLRMRLALPVSGLSKAAIRWTLKPGCARTWNTSITGAALDWKILLRTIPRVLSGRGAN